MYVVFNTYAYIIRTMNVLKHIRTVKFAVTQAEFSAIAGVTQATVSRWENGVPPSLDEMRAIRSAAIERELDWDDSIFFEEPAQAAE